MIKIRVAHYQYGWYIEGYKQIDQKTASLYNNDNLMAGLMGVFVKDYVTMLKENGATGPDNGRTHFATEEEALGMLPVIQELIDAVNTMKKLSSRDLIGKKKSFTVLDF